MPFFLLCSGSFFCNKARLKTYWMEASRSKCFCRSRWPIAHTRTNDVELQLLLLTLKPESAGLAQVLHCVSMTTKSRILWDRNSSLQHMKELYSHITQKQNHITKYSCRYINSTANLKYCTFRTLTPPPFWELRDRDAAASHDLLIFHYQ